MLQTYQENEKYETTFDKISLNTDPCQSSSVQIKTSRATYQQSWKQIQMWKRCRQWRWWVEQSSSVIGADEAGSGGGLITPSSSQFLETDTPRKWQIKTFLASEANFNIGWCSSGGVLLNQAAVPWNRHTEKMKSQNISRLGNIGWCSSGGVLLHQAAGRLNFLKTFLASEANFKT